MDERWGDSERNGGSKSGREWRRRAGKTEEERMSDGCMVVLLIHH